MGLESLPVPPSGSRTAGTMCITHRHCLHSVRGFACAPHPQNPCPGWDWPLSSPQHTSTHYSKYGSLCMQNFKGIKEWVENNGTHTVRWKHSGPKPLSPDEPIGHTWNCYAMLFNLINVLAVAPHSEIGEVREAFSNPLQEKNNRVWRGLGCGWGKGIWS